MVRDPSPTQQAASHARMASPAIELTPEAQAVLQLWEHTQQHIFLTGRAGTGKSTLLQHFRTTTRKRLVVLAPTGVAAVNVHGQTIHAFFGFGPDITPEKARRRALRKKQLYRNLQALIIDEISMVRADLLDCIDQFLRVNGPRAGAPFGGVQLLFIGDLYQLPPVVLPEEETLFTIHYASPYFFDAHVLRATPYTVIHLTKSAERPRRSRRGWIGVGRAGLNAQEPNNTHAVPEPSMGEGTAWVEALAFMPGRTSTAPSLLALPNDP